ncbi:MAG: hypothetical protein Q7N87_05150 [Candidatus Uhrbacteria bacterium]|nr:hypothetical protein [Candidatus Uhrbacteria bacterium]
MPSSEPTLQDLLDAMNAFASHVDEQFKTIRSEMVTKQELAREFAKFETRMVSKDYLDAKLTDQYTDLVRLFRRELARA